MVRKDHACAALAATLLLAASALPALAQSNGSIGLRGTMETICFVQINQTNTNSIDLIKGTSNLTIGTVGEKCNRGNGFTVTISSANAGALVNATGARAAYTVQYDNSGVKSLTNPVVLTRTSAKKTVSTKSFKVNIPANPQAIAGTYADTITVAIAAR